MTVPRGAPYGPPPMRLKVNGEERVVADGATILGLLESLGLEPERVAVERNRLLCRRASWADTVLQDGDEVEVLTFVGGG